MSTYGPDKIFNNKYGIHKKEHKGLFGVNKTNEKKIAKKGDNLLINIVVFGD